MDHNGGWHPISLEDALGPVDGRYFGAGYRSVRHQLDITPVAGELRGIGAVRYPLGWSTGADGHTRTPHLSTIDAVTLPLMAIEKAEGCPSSTHVSRIVLWAGSEPWLELGDIPVEVRPQATRATPADHCNYAARIGNIRVEIQLSSRPGVNSKSEKPGLHTVYADLHKGTEGSTVLTDYNQETGELSASHGFRAPIPKLQPKAHTLEGAFWPAMCAVDYLVTIGQVVQVLIAERTGVDRGSGNLWMRKVEMDLPNPPSSLPCEFGSNTKPIDEKTIERDDRRIHHIVTETQTTNGVRIVSKLAHVEKK